MSRSFALAAVLSLTLLFASCSSTKLSVESANVKPANTRKVAAEFALKDVNGQPVKLADYRGKIVLLNFWATWCGPCKMEIPWFIEFEQKFKDKGFAVLGVSMDEEGWQVVRPYLEKQKVNYRVVVGDDSIAQAYGGVDSLPTTFLLDREGKVASLHIGLVSKSDYQNEIEALIKAN